MFSALSQIAKHSVDLAEMVVEAEIFPAVLSSLTNSDEYVKKNVAMLIREVAKHTPEVCNFCFRFLFWEKINIVLTFLSKQG